MKKRILKSIAIMLSIILVFPMLSSLEGVTASAATKPSISVASKTIVGLETTFTLNVRNAGKTAKKLTWYSSNKKIATVEATLDPTTVKVTTVGKGVTSIKCKITYKSGAVLRPGCKLTVKVPATGVAINNAKDYQANNNRHIIAIGESYDFNRTLTPSNASDRLYWYIEEDDRTDGKKSATVNLYTGVVTALEPGFFRLKAVASLTAAGAKTSVINDAINVEVVAKTAKVKSVVLLNATKLTVTFDRAINPNTVIGTNSKLLDTVILAALIDAKKNVANALGNLTGSLSVDGKTLTIQSTNAFNGTYGIRISSAIKTLDGISLESYNDNIELYDTLKPQYVDYTVNDTGYIVSVNFSEAMNFTNMMVTDAKTINGAAALPITLTMLNTKSNYTISEDKKSLIIDLTSMASTDQNKMFSIVLSNITDMSGNFPASYPMMAYLKTDTTPKAQAQLISIVRSGYNTLTATFTRTIRLTGMVVLSNGETLQGTIDKDDAKKVNYTLLGNAVNLYGNQDVSIGYWDSFNVSTTDNSANTLTKRSVYFTIDKAIPVLLNSVLEMETNNGIDTYVLTMNYNKDVILTSPSGTFATKLVATDGDINSSNNISYTAIASASKVTLILNQAQIIKNGIYTITIPAGFVYDSYKNMSNATEVKVNKSAAVSSTLSAPKEVSQSAANPNIIYVGFDKKLDQVSAENVTNYSITGVTITKAELIDNTSTGATIQLTLLQGSIISTTVYPITIVGIKGYQDSYSTMEKHSALIGLHENKSPALLTHIYSYPYTITLTFDEDIKGTANFKVLQDNIELNTTSVINGRTITISLSQAPKLNVIMQLLPTQFNALTDLSGNIITEPLIRFINPTIN